LFFFSKFFLFAELREVVWTVSGLPKFPVGHLHDSTDKMAFVVGLWSLKFFKRGLSIGGEGRRTSRKISGQEELAMVETREQKGLLWF